MGSPEGALARLDASPCASVQAASGEAAGLVSSKTTDPTFLDVSFHHEIVQERRVGRLRRTVWACGHLQRFATPKGFRENVWFCTLTYRGVDDWQPGHISRCLKAVRKWCKKRGVAFRYVWVPRSLLPDQGQRVAPLVGVVTVASADNSAIFRVGGVGMSKSRRGEPCSLPNAARHLSREKQAEMGDNKQRISALAPSMLWPFPSSKAEVPKAAIDDVEDRFICLTPRLHSAIFNADILTILAQPNQSDDFFEKLELQSYLCSDFYLSWKRNMGSIETEKEYRSRFLTALPKWVSDLPAFHIVHLCQLSFREDTRLPDQRPAPISPHKSKKMD